MGHSLTPLLDLPKKANAVATEEVWEPSFLSTLMLATKSIVWLHQLLEVYRGLKLQTLAFFRWKWTVFCGMNIVFIFIFYRDHIISLILKIFGFGWDLRFRQRSWGRQSGGQPSLSRRPAGLTGEGLADGRRLPLAWSIVLKRTRQQSIRWKGPGSFPRGQ